MNNQAVNAFRARMKSTTEYVLERAGQFNEYDSKIQQEYYGHKKKYLWAIRFVEEPLTLAARAGAIGLPLLGMLLNWTTTIDVNWLGASGAVITLIGIALQIHWTQQSSIVTEMQAIDLEREVRFSIYYNFRTHPFVVNQDPFLPGEEESILNSLHNTKATELRKLRGNMVKKQNYIVAGLIIYGTLIWAFA